MLAAQAREAAPDQPPVLMAYAMLARELDRAGAVGSLRAALDREPGNVAGYGLLAEILGADGTRDVEAAALFEEYARRSLPSDAMRAVHLALAAFRNRIGDAAGAMELLDALGPAPGLAHLRFLSALYGADWDDAAVIALKRRLDAADPHPSPASRQPAAARARPRVGFVGPDLGGYNYMALFSPLLAHFDRAAWDIAVVSTMKAAAGMAALFARYGAEFVEMTGVADADDFAARVAALDLDVLVELGDALTPLGRPLVRRAPARRCAVWFNMTGPAGDPAWAASIGNAALYPDETLSLFAERCVRLPADAFVYDPEFAIVAPPPVSPAPCGTGGPVTFGSLSHAYKIGSPCLDLWAEALRAAPQARFHLANAAMAEPAARARFVRAMEARGIAPERLSFDTVKGWPGYLAGYAKIDLALATFPVAGGTTMFEAAYQGVPSLSLRGGHALARIGDWLARAIDVPWTACADFGEYRARAAALAADPSPLIDARATWRGRLREKSRADAPRVARALQDAILDLAR